MSYSAARTRHPHDRAARDRMKRLEPAVGIPDDRRLNATANTGVRKHPRATVTQVTCLMFLFIAFADVVEAVLTVAR